jgi:ubiquitin fusion degradation protein 1
MKSFRLGQKEQIIEDANNEIQYTDLLERRLMVLPLTDSFASSKYNAMFDKVQFSDRCCLPQSLGSQLSQGPTPPWILRLTPEEIITSPKVSAPSLHSVYVSALDFRAPDNYIYVPAWVMNSLGLKSFDVVNLRFVRLKGVSRVTLQPQSIRWNSLSSLPEVSTLLEKELSRYSALTVGSVIQVKINNEEHPLLIKEALCDRGVKVEAVYAADSDVQTIIDRSEVERQELEQGTAN